MKIKSEDYEYIVLAFKTVDKQALEQHKLKVLKEGSYINFNTRIVYDIARAAGLLSFVCDVLYKYADDSHIKTAYIKAAKELDFI